MAAADASSDTPDRVAAALRDADFVRLVATADGDALAATGLLARALDAAETPFQASLAAVPGAPATDADCTIAVGHSSGAGTAGAGSAADVTLEETPLSVAAADVARTIAPDAVDPVLALAGITAAGEEPAGALLEAARLDRRPGVAVPTPDRVDGLAGSTLVHAEFSGDEAAAEAALADLGGDDADGGDVDGDEADGDDADGGEVDGDDTDDDSSDAPEADPDAVDDRTLASYVALSAVQDAPPRAAEAVERALHPYDCERFETVGGYADVLDAVARVRPGTGIALALGHDVESAALESWQAHGRQVHAAIRAAETARYDGVSVARVVDEADVADDNDDATGDERNDAGSDTVALLGTVARLLFEYRSPEPIALVVTDGAAAVAAEPESSVEDALRTAATAHDGRATARDGRGAATFDENADDFVDAFRGAL